VLDDLLVHLVSAERHEPETLGPTDLNLNLNMDLNVKLPLHHSALLNLGGWFIRTAIRIFEYNDFLIPPRLLERIHVPSIPFIARSISGLSVQILPPIVLEFRCVIVNAGNQ
jgi:hypothetical protein